MRINLPDGTIEKQDLYKIGFNNTLDNASKTYDTSHILQRTETGISLSNLVETVEDPQVLTLSSDWGTGKTWFLQRWVGSHHIEYKGQALTVYFSAFNNDYLADPLAAIMSAVNERLTLETDSKSKNQSGAKREKAQVFFNKAAHIILAGTKAAALTGLHYATVGGSSVFKNNYDSQAQNQKKGKQPKDAEEYAKTAKDFWEEQRLLQNIIEEFKDALREFAKESKLVIVIDELDRARPDYALSVLETIKHFFKVDNVHFILGVNMQALEGIVNCRYGQIQAQAYLQRFINLEIKLPNIAFREGKAVQATVNYAEWAAKEMNLPQEAIMLLVEHLQAITPHQKISLRDTDRILSKYAFTIASIRPEVFLSLPLATIYIYLTLLTTSIIQPELYRKIINIKFSEHDILSYFGIDELDFRNKATDYRYCIEEIDKRDARFGFNILMYQFDCYKKLSSYSHDNPNNSQNNLSNTYKSHSNYWKQIIACLALLKAKMPLTNIDNAFISDPTPPNTTQSQALGIKIIAPQANIAATIN